MTGRERTRRALTFQKPDRAPRDVWALPFVSLFRKAELDSLMQRYPMDICASQLSPGWSDKVVQASAHTGAYTDDWGSVWFVGEPGVIGEVKRPAVTEWKELDRFQPPWHLVRERDLSYTNRSCEQSDQFMLSDVTARPFERLQFIRGTENLFIDLADGTAGFHKLLEMVHEFYLEDIRSWCSSNVDAVFFMDDWGTKDCLLINPEVWRVVFKPLYKEYVEMIHAAGKFAFFHSDGNTEQIFSDLVEVGIDAINAQLFTMNLEEIARKYKGTISFWGEIDRQHVLPFGKREDVRAAVQRVRSALDDGLGGLIAQCEWGKDNPAENIEAVFEYWLT
jgi:uroporphyrinogen decarboxylase